MCCLTATAAAVTSVNELEVELRPDDDPWIIHLALLVGEVPDLDDARALVHVPPPDRVAELRDDPALGRGRDRARHVADRERQIAPARRRVVAAIGADPRPLPRSKRVRDLGRGGEPDFLPCSRLLRVDEHPEPIPEAITATHVEGSEVEADM